MFSGKRFITPGRSQRSRQTSGQHDLLAYGRAHLIMPCKVFAIVAYHHCITRARHGLCARSSTRLARYFIITASSSGGRTGVTKSGSTRNVAGAKRGAFAARNTGKPLFSLIYILLGPSKVADTMTSSSSTSSPWLPLSSRPSSASSYSSQRHGCGHANMPGLSLIGSRSASLYGQWALSYCTMSGTLSASPMSVTVPRLCVMAFNADLRCRRAAITPLQRARPGFTFS